MLAIMIAMENGSFVDPNPHTFLIDQKIKSSGYQGVEKCSLTDKKMNFF